eukprot:Seg1237.4 transcript_id=Seg1237.4/GoldUCD/mRNA.D3Y31 product="hypothetical protein" protein_id=Seg1237.4/GoldUCD/D3Y31
MEYAVQIFIDNGWDRSRLKDPDGGIHINRIVEENLPEDIYRVKKIIDSPPEKTDKNWTQSLLGLPLGKIVHSGVESFFEKSGDEKHIKEGYTFSRTLKFETSGKPMRINFIDENLFVLEGYTRPAMKSSKGIARGEGIYHCMIVYSMKTGQIQLARDYSCPAGKRGYCKHIAALAYKLVDCAMAKKQALPATLTCTQIKQQWNLPSLRAEQDPEKEIMKRKPLQEISFQCRNLDRDLSSGRKRRLPDQVDAEYCSKPPSEPSLDEASFKQLEIDLEKSHSPSMLLLVIKTGRKTIFQNNENSAVAPNILPPLQTSISKQGSKEWFASRVGKVTSSKIPLLMGLSGQKEFTTSWSCIAENVEEEHKAFLNFERGKRYESVAACEFEAASGLDLFESPFVPFPGDPERFGASPDRIFEIDSFFLRDGSNALIELSGKYIVEIKTRAIGSSRPLQTLHGSHICQCQLQMCCLSNVPAVILFSFLPETKQFTMFFIERDSSFIKVMLSLCQALRTSNKMPRLDDLGNSLAEEVSSVLAGKVPDFKSMLPMRRWANNIARNTKQVFFLW